MPLSPRMRGRGRGRARSRGRGRGSRGRGKKAVKVIKDDASIFKVCIFFALMKSAMCLV
jgi:hypothetical protein